MPVMHEVGSGLSGSLTLVPRLRPAAVSTILAPTVMEVLRRFAPAYQNDPRCLSGTRRVLQKILGCRTGALGWHLYHCSQCGHLEAAANRCASRHCPECTRQRCREWHAKVSAWSLPVNYLHLVFTLPHGLNPLLAENTSLIKLLLTVVRKLLLRVAKKQYGCTPGFIMVLHTWGQEVKYHVHVHVLMTSGGLALDHTKWISMYDDDEPLQRYALAKPFRQAYLAGLRAMFEAGRLKMPRGMAWIKNTSDLEAWLRRCYRHAWMVDVQGAPDDYQGPGAALRYLARYAKASAIKDSRMVRMTDTDVTIHAHDYRHGRDRDITISGVDFVHRFAMHFLPRNIARVRYCGLFHPPTRSARVDTCRSVLQHQRLLGKRSLTTPLPTETKAGVRCGRCGYFPMTSSGYLSTDTVAARLADYHRQMADCTSRMHTTDVRGDWQLAPQLYRSVSVMELQLHDAQGMAVYVVGAVRDTIDIQFVMHAHGPAP